MSVDLHIDNRLIEKAIEAGRHKTADEAVTSALEEYVRLREAQGRSAAAAERMKILEWVGKVDYFDDYDHKEFRRKLR